MANELTGKVIVVTGACGGVGRGVVKALAEAGACLALVDKDADRLAPLIQEELGGDTECYKGFPADLSEAGSVDDLINHVIDNMNQIDGLVHAVGGYAAGEPVHESGMDVYDKMMALNTRMVYLVCGKIAAHMVETATPGSISIVLARAGAKGSKNHGAYTASKAAATRIMESMAIELREHNIRVNGISPSIVDTPPNREAMSNADFDKWVKPYQIGELMVFLQSDESKAITGANIEISGKV